ncbi:hypothetical protein B0H14DRAFT_2629514 [Mycena olivaceomarginata]|nr:hypothetical protein B0H14DRAFT_2629514 [Mycena olivaceomarginata]
MPPFGSTFVQLLSAIGASGVTTVCWYASGREGTRNGFVGYWLPDSKVQGFLNLGYSMPRSKAGDRDQTVTKLLSSSSHMDHRASASTIMDSKQSTGQESMCPGCGNARRAVSIAAPTLEDTRKAIDEEIVWHYAKMDLLKAKRNAMAPIFSLPNELMTRVITIFAVDSNTLFNLKWTKLMRVCPYSETRPQGAEEGAAVLYFHPYPPFGTATRNGAEGGRREGGWAHQYELAKIGAMSCDSGVT